MDKRQFIEYAERGYNRIPRTREVLADLDTPLSTYLKLADGPYSYLFESVQGGEKWGRYSIIGLPCSTIVSVRGHEISVTHQGRLLEEVRVEDPLQWVEQFQQRYRAPDMPDLPLFSGGLVGYFGYDTVRYIEPRLAHCPNEDTLGTPDILLMLSEEVVVFDNLSGKIRMVVYCDPSQVDAFEMAGERLDQLTMRLSQATCLPPSGRAQTVNETDFVSGFTRQGYEDAVGKAKQYIIDGDVMQVVLSQRLSIPFSAHPLHLYRALRFTNPSPYMYYLNVGDFHVVGSSPEILTRLEDGEVTVRPIAGTRPRGATEAEDMELERDLLADPKECAEHLMLIDLGRNDVGRISQTGTVRLTEKMIVERYSHVMHIVSNVIGRVKNDVSAMDVLRATFPAGTLSGAPKIRAMEIIDELEPVKRGVYSGAVGYIGWNGNMDTAIAIRTAVIKDGVLSIQAGAGIVYDSIPEKEWEETMNKGRAVFKAVELVEAGLDDFQMQGKES
ncbi:MAG: anthranilate synthase component I [Gammaproteobacteria bacterium]|nr:anthranilate synthase component I [Gammaproteobacteria bacterium]MDH5800796.1 anthranilate synthase component I [Gammaproteobacteria bacterium]